MFMQVLGHDKNMENVQYEFRFGTHVLVYLFTVRKLEWYSYFTRASRKFVYVFDDNIYITILGRQLNILNSVINPYLFA